MAFDDESFHQPLSLSLSLDAVEATLRGGNGSGAHLETNRPVIIEQTVGSWWVKLVSRIERLTVGRGCDEGRGNP